MTDQPLVDYTVQDTTIPDNNPFERVPKAQQAKGRPSNHKRPVPTWQPGAIAKFVETTYQGAGRLASTVDDTIGAGILDIAEPAGKAWEKLAKQHMGLRRFFAWAMSGSLYAELIILHAPLGMIVATRYGPFAVREKMDELGEEFRAELNNVLLEESGVE